MDPFSAEGELINIYNAFHQGQYETVLDFDTTTLSPENHLPARVLQLRAKIAQGHPAEVLSEIESDSADGDKPELLAVKALAQFASGDADSAEKVASDLAAKTEGDDNASVLVCCGIILQGVGKSEEALAVLGRHQGSLEAVALIVQIHLQQNRSDLALKEVQAAKRWAQDSLLVNLAEAWVGMRIGGEQYQSAFYVFEELASTPSTTASLSIVGQAVAELHLGRLPEAEAALAAALEKYPNEIELISNSVVLNALAGKPTADLEQRLQQAQPSHSLLFDIQEKSELFDTAASKYAPRVSS